MSDQNFREIQLGGKQLVFLFMALLVGAVAVFLLGISVGRGVRDAEGETATTDVAVAGQPPAPAGEMPPPTETAPGDLRYHDQLQGPTPSAAATPKTAPATEPAAAVPPVTPPAPPATEKPAVADRTTAKPGTPAADAGWFVQVDAFRSRENADRRVAYLKGRGYASASVSVGGSGSLFRVRVGPFAQRDEADRTRQRMATEGIKSSVQR